jgi:hypothetical protein
MVYVTHATDIISIEEWMPLDGKKRVKRKKKLITKAEYQIIKQRWQV